MRNADSKLHKPQYEIAVGKQGGQKSLAKLRSRKFEGILTGAKMRAIFFDAALMIGFMIVVLLALIAWFLPL